MKTVLNIQKWKWKYNLVLFHIFFVAVLEPNREQINWIREVSKKLFDVTHPSEHLNLLGECGRDVRFGVLAECPVSRLWAIYTSCIVHGILAERKWWNIGTNMNAHCLRPSTASSGARMGIVFPVRMEFLGVVAQSGEGMPMNILRCFTSVAVAEWIAVTVWLQSLRRIAVVRSY